LQWPGLRLSGRALTEKTMNVLFGLDTLGNARRDHPMSNIIKFPSKVKSSAQAAPQPVVGQHKPMLDVSRLTLFEKVMRVIWLLVVLTWPLVSWAGSIYVFFQFLRMLYHWNTPGSYAGWSFLAHFAMLVVLVCFITMYKPKGIE
jgi:hypothetical protein